MDTDFWSWFAGFWEGEGTIGVYKGRQVEICAVQRVRSPLDYIEENVGLGTVVPEYDREGELMWRWRVRSRPQILEVGRKLLPCLRFRTQEMKVALAKIQKMEDERHWNDWTDDELTFLKNNYDKIPPKDIVTHLPRHTYNAIFTKRKTLNLKGGKWLGRNGFS